MTDHEPKPKPTVKLVGCDGNAFILGKVKRALVQAGLEDQVEPFMTEATAGDYQHLLATVMQYCEIE